MKYSSKNMNGNLYAIWVESKIQGRRDLRRIGTPEKLVEAIVEIAKKTKQPQQTLISTGFGGEEAED